MDDLKTRIPRICPPVAIRGAAPFRRRAGRDSAFHIRFGRRPPTVPRREDAPAVREPETSGKARPAFPRTGGFRSAGTRAERGVASSRIKRPAGAAGPAKNAPDPADCGSPAAGSETVRRADTRRMTGGLQTRIPRISPPVAIRGAAPSRRLNTDSSFSPSVRPERSGVSQTVRNGSSPESPPLSGGAAAADGAADETQFRNPPNARNAVGYSAGAGSAHAPRPVRDRNAPSGITAGAGGRPAFSHDDGPDRETLRELRRIASLLNEIKPILREDRRLELE